MRELFVFRFKNISSSWSFNLFWTSDMISLIYVKSRWILMNSNVFTFTLNCLKQKIFMQQYSYTLNLIKMQFLRFCISTISLYTLRMPYQFSLNSMEQRDGMSLLHSHWIFIYHITVSPRNKHVCVFKFHIVLMWHRFTENCNFIVSGISHERQDVLFKNSWIDYLFMHVLYYVPSTLFSKALELSFMLLLHDALVLETSITFFWEPPTKADAAIFSFSFLVWLKNSRSISFILFVSFIIPGDKWIIVKTQWNHP